MDQEQKEAIKGIVNCVYPVSNEPFNKLLTLHHINSNPADHTFEKVNQRSYNVNEIFH